MLCSTLTLKRCPCELSEDHENDDDHENQWQWQLSWQTFFSSMYDNDHANQSHVAYLFLDNNHR